MEIVVAEPEQVDAMVAITEQARANMASGMISGSAVILTGVPGADVAAGAAYVAGRGTRGGCVPLRR
ncbi:MAG: hypothetical protein ACLSGS_11295 [Adlercreutzia sp.]